MTKLIIMYINFIRAPCRLDLVERRLQENSRICEDYQNRLFTDIVNIGLDNRDASITEPLDKIKSCLKEVKLKVIRFESSKFGRGYRINCNDSQRREFVEMILVIVHNSDYITTLIEIYHNRGNSSNARKLQLIGLIRKYKKLRSWITMLENTEDTNMYNNY
jgi:hypothetical protein